MSTNERAVLAGGCFWGMQDLIRKMNGVISTRVGYTGGDVPNATYRNHGSHAEGIEIVFDPAKLSYRTLLEFFFQIHDPTTRNRQGNDMGASYRSAIYTTSDEQKRVAADTIADVNVSRLWPGRVVTDRGAGESHTELDRRKLRDQISDLKKEIAGMDAERQTQRARRRERDELATVALVGYTNAGKSTLMRALTASEVLVADKLFATLDTTVRALQPASTPRILVSDTVGFIKNLPHGLVASFKSTLEETLEASLLLHVVDASDAGWERQVEVTDAVLDEIGATEVPRIRIFNKIDHVGDSAAQAEREAALRVRYPECIVMSAHRAEDVVRLHAVIVGFFREQLIEAELFLPWSAQQLRGEIFARCEMLEERADGDGAFFRVRGDEATLNSLREHIAAGQ